MNTNKIREVLLKAMRSHTQEMEGYAYFASNKGLSEDDYEEVVDEALAELDKAQQPGKVLTDEEIEHIADVEHVDSGNRMSGMWRDGFVEGLRHARDHYGIGAPAAGLTVDEAMEALQEHIDREGWAMTEPNRWRFRARLTAAIEAKARTA